MLSVLLTLSSATVGQFYGTSLSCVDEAYYYVHGRVARILGSDDMGFQGTFLPYEDGTYTFTISVSRSLPVTFSFNSQIILDSQAVSPYTYAVTLSKFYRYPYSCFIPSSSIASRGIVFEIRFQAPGGVESRLSSPYSDCTMTSGCQNAAYLPENNCRPGPTQTASPVPLPTPHFTLWANAILKKRFRVMRIGWVFLSV
jgi:hypothetical protein